MVQASDIVLARRRLTGYLRPTALEATPALGTNVWLKLENTNRAHAFKARGALNAVLALSEAARARGLIAASSGNHAQGLAYAAQVAGVRARILMPLHTPKRKVDGVRQYGAEAVLFGANYDETEAEARRQEQAEGLTYISPYNDPQVVAGAGTVALEILDDLPTVRRVVIPVSGGGLISGMGIALKNADPTIEVIGVASEHTPALHNYLTGSHLPQNFDTLAEALSGDIEAGSITLDISRRVVDRSLLVSEAAIAAAMRWLALEAGWIVEGGGAVGVAALQSGLLPDDSKPTVIVLSGGNVDADTLRRVLTT